MCEMRTFIGEIQYEAEFEYEKLILLCFVYVLQSTKPKIQNRWCTKLEGNRKPKPTPNQLKTMKR